MYLIVAFITEVLAFLMLLAAAGSGYFTYQAYEKLPQEIKTGPPLKMLQTTQELQLGVSACVTALFLFVLFMLAYAVIDTARHTRKILARLEQTQP
jgi:hypothetical protein